MLNCGMRQMEERHVANQVELMVWSNRLDLLAISNFKGEVQVHRLHWQKVWNLPPPKENVSVQAMAWRPDGKALAIGYSSGTVHIVDVEDKDILDKYDFDLGNPDKEMFESNDSSISCITWAVKAGTLESATEYNIYDDSSIFLQKPESPSTSYKNQGSDDNTKNFKEILEQSQLNMLIVGYGSGHIHMSIFGRFPYGDMHLAEILKDECGEYKILNISLSDDFSVMHVVYLDKITNNILLAIINTSVLSAFAEELFSVATRHGQIIQLITYLVQTMSSITESWEHILLEMDNKMASYASSVSEGGVSADFLELLMFGVPSTQLELFLLNELSAKGLKKFCNSVELSYSTIQKLVLKQLNIVGQCLTYHLAELRGLTRIPDRYKIFEFNENTVTNAIRACCAFLNKCLELQQVIDVSMRNYKAFFRWLFDNIVRISEEQAPNDKMTQQELSHISEFLYNFDVIHGEPKENSSEKSIKFNLERLAQYLEDQELTLLPDDEDNPWHKFLRENSCLLKGNDTIFSMMEFRKFSLVQQQNYLINAVYEVFDESGKSIEKYFSILKNLKCCENTDNIKSENIKVTQIFDAGQQRFMVAFINIKYPSEGICFITLDIKEQQCSVKAGKYYFSSNLLRDNIDQSVEDELALLDIEYYSTEYLSVLTKHPHNAESTIFIQLPLKNILEGISECNTKCKCKCSIFTDKLPKKNITALVDQGFHKILEKMDAHKIAVSGGRKVAVVLSNSQRKVRVFEMEVNAEDEDDETFDVTPQAQEFLANDNDSVSASEQLNETIENVTF